MYNNVPGGLIMLPGLIFFVFLSSSCVCLHVIVSKNGAQRKVQFCFLIILIYEYACIMYAFMVGGIQES